MDGQAERAGFEIDERHLDGGFRLRRRGHRAVHAGERGVQVEGIGPAEGGRQRPHRGVYLLGGNRRVAGRRVDVAPALGAGLGLDADEQATLDRGHAVHAVDRRAERDVDENRLDCRDSHGAPSMASWAGRVNGAAPAVLEEVGSVDAARGQESAKLAEPGRLDLTDPLAGQAEPPADRLQLFRGITLQSEAPP